VTDTHQNEAEWYFWLVPKTKERGYGKVGSRKLGDAGNYLSSRGECAEMARCCDVVVVRPRPCISLLCMTWRIVSSVGKTGLLSENFVGEMADKQGISGRLGFRRQPFPPFSTAPPPSSLFSGSPGSTLPLRSSWPAKSPVKFFVAHRFETWFEMITKFRDQNLNFCGVVGVVSVWWAQGVGLEIHRQKQHIILPIACPSEQRMREEIRK
jgi:hypothetical protein